jgi:hypothetical protein
MDLAIGVLLLLSLFLLFGLKEPASNNLEAPAAPFRLQGGRVLLTVLLLAGAWWLLYTLNHNRLFNTSYTGGDLVYDSDMLVRGPVRLIVLGILALPCVFWVSGIRIPPGSRFFLVLLANWLLWIGASILLNLTSDYALNILGLFIDKYPLVRLSFIIVGISALIAGWLADLLGRKPLLIVGGGLTGFFITVLLFPSPPFYLLAIAVLSAGYGIVQSVGWIWLADSLPEPGAHGRDTGIWLTLLHTSQIAVYLSYLLLKPFAYSRPQTSFVFTSLAGYVVVFLIALLCCIGGIVCLLRARPQPK